MASRRLPWVILFFGLVFAVSPLYWGLFQNLGIAVVVDWFRAFGIGVRTDLYYLAIGGLYVAATLLTLRTHRDRSLDFRTLALGVGAALLVVWAGTLLYGWSATRPHGVAFVAFTIATGPVMLAFLVGATPDGRSVRPLFGLMALHFLPLIGLFGAVLLEQPAVGLGTIAGVVYIGLLVVLDAIWAYPLYRLGKTTTLASA